MEGGTAQTRPVVSSRTAIGDGDFPKGVAASPDGLCAVTWSEQRKIDLFETVGGEGDAVDRVGRAFRVDEADTVHHCVWWPHMSSSDPASCVFASTSKGSPIKLWDAYTGALRASYCAQDHNDEPTSAYSLAFAGQDLRLFGGYEHAIRMFHLSRPGRSADTLRTTPTRRSKQGQKGIISTLCAVGCDSIAAASFRGSVWLYDASRLSLRPVRSLGTPHSKGATCVAASADGTLLASGGRLDDSVHVWDLRQTRQRLCSVPRTARTNQRLSFVFAPCGTLWVGDCSGTVCGWDMLRAPSVPPCTASARVHECVNGVDVSPAAPSRVVLSTGERVFHCPDSDSDEEGGSGGPAAVASRGTITTLRLPA